MRIDIRFLPAALLVGAVLAAGAPPGQKAEAGKTAPDLTPLVRLDLLKALPPEPAAPIRDIFNPGRAVAAPEAVETPDATQAPAGEEPGVEAPPEAAPEEPLLELAYLGYVTSGRKIVALVISQGQAMAVAEGEEIVPGVTVVKIGPDRIEVTGPGGKKMSVPIQGEQP
jgi:hypothetical protein